MFCGQIMIIRYVCPQSTSRSCILGAQEEILDAAAERTAHEFVTFIDSFCRQSEHTVKYLKNLSRHSSIMGKTTAFLGNCRS